MELEGSVVVITNAASTQAQAQARRFASEGAEVVLVAAAVESDADQRTLDALIRLDPVDESAWEEAARTVLERHGRIDVLVHNAVSRADETVPALSPNGWDEAFDSAATSGFLAVRAVLPAMQSQRAGSIVLVTSVAAMAPPRGLSEAHAASAGALRQLAKDVSADYAAEGIRCNALFAGLVEGELLGTEPVLTLAAAEEIRLLTPMRRSAQHDEIAAAVRFLSSPDASFITGAELVVDGGYVAF